MGNIVGEFLGELFLNGFFLVSAVAIARSTQRQWLLFAGAFASGLGWIAMLRNLTHLVAPIAEINNIALPIWMLTLGIVLLRSSPPKR
jgi:drug/metabolite transporter (DMT)-like permease